MDGTTTPKIRNVRKKFVSPSVSSPYRSPLLHRPTKSVKTSVSDMSLEDLKASTKELFEKNNVLKQQIHDLQEQGYTEEKLQWYIDKFHEYNEIKDVAQMVMGQIAILDQTTVKKVHEEFGMTGDD